MNRTIQAIRSIVIIIISSALVIFAFYIPNLNRVTRATIGIFYVLILAVTLSWVFIRNFKK